MRRNRNTNRKGKQVSTTQEIDLGTLSPEHLKNVQEVYKIMAFLLDEDANYEALTVEQQELINTACTSIKIRDGVLKYFGDAPFDVRVDIMKAFTIISQVIVDRVDADDDDVDTEPIGNITMMIAALMLCHAGMLSDFDEDRDVDYELALVDKLLNEAEALGCQASLLNLLQIARRHDIPPIVFYQSLVAVSFHKVTDPTGHLND
jgi:hypothetical protein